MQNDNDDLSLPQVDDDSQDQQGAAHSQPSVVPGPLDVGHDSGLEAEDVDLIEKSWVEKAKSIVEDTQGDPYRQNEELSKMKTEYLRKRYNKEINSGD